MKISVAMATYNGAKYLDDQLQSFLDQTRQPDELVITDDCSSDQTETIVLEFKKKAPFIVSFSRNKKNLGYCGNFNRALANTSGDLIFLSDQDDVWLPDKLAYMEGMAKKHPDALVLMNDAILTNGDLIPVGLTKLGQIYSAGYGDSSFTMGCCCAIRRRLLDICLPIPPGYAAHDDWVVRFAEVLGKKYVFEQPLQYYRRHETNVSTFIANRTEKISKGEVAISRLVRLFKSISDEDVSKSAAQADMFLEGLRAGESRVSAGEAERIRREFDRIVSVRCCQEARREARKKPLAKRLVSVWGLYQSGMYSSKKKVLSILRDAIGWPK